MRRPRSLGREFGVLQASSDNLFHDFIESLAIRRSLNQKTCSSTCRNNSHGITLMYVPLIPRLRSDQKFSIPFV